MTPPTYPDAEPTMSPKDPLLGPVDGSVARPAGTTGPPATTLSQTPQTNPGGVLTVSRNPGCVIMTSPTTPVAKPTPPISFEHSPTNPADADPHVARVIQHTAAPTESPGESSDVKGTGRLEEAGNQGTWDAQDDSDNTGAFPEFVRPSAQDEVEPP